MTNERATGLILRTRRLTETSLIVHWLTPDLGRLATAAKGGLRPKSPFQGKLDLFFEADFSFARSRRSDLHTLREVSLRHAHAKLRQDLSRLRVAAYAARWIELATETETPLPEAFALMRNVLAWLDTAPATPSVVFAFELALLTTSGLGPAIGQTALSAGARKALALLAVPGWTQLDRFYLSAPQVHEIERYLRQHLLTAWHTMPSGRAEALGLAAVPDARDQRR